MRASRPRLIQAIAFAVAVVALVAIFLQVRATASRTASTPHAATLDAAFASHVPDDQAGCAAAAYQGDSIVWTAARGLAIMAGRHPITDDTLFGLGVTTQQFTGTAVLLLVQQGRLRMDDPLSKYVRGLPAWSHSVRIRNLVLGTSGIPNAHDLLQAQPGPITTRTVLAAMRKARLDFPPGGGGDDTDGDYQLLGLVVRAVTHRSLAAFLAADVFPVAGMRSAVLDRDPTGPNVAESYQLPSDTDPYHDELWRTVGDIGLHASAKDLATWGAQFWRPTVGGPQVARARMTTVRGNAAGKMVLGAEPVSTALSSGAGVGVWTDEGGRLIAGAAAPDEVGFSEDAFQSDLIVIPSQRLAVAVLCNHLQPDPHVASELALRLLGVLRGRTVPHPYPYP